MCDLLLIKLMLFITESYIHNGNLHIPIVANNDGGSYTCTASNQLGEDAKTVQLKIRGNYHLWLKTLFIELRMCNLFVRHSFAFFCVGGRKFQLEEIPT